MIVDNSNQTIGIRFVDLNIPKGAIISNAHIQFATEQTNNLNPCTIEIYGEAHDDPPTFVNSKQ